MDLGATVCLRRKPKCTACPLIGQCVARASDRVGELPEPRARKTLPLRETVMLLLLYKAQVLLERRPPAGIWGALWSLPEVAAQGDAEQICRTRFGVAAASLTRVESIEHGFTHFRLRIHPLRVEVHALEPQAGEPGRIWLPLAEAIGAAIPVPVRRILQAS
jgi:A/G-specific adenine glycosylase